MREGTEWGSWVVETPRIVSVFRDHLVFLFSLQMLPRELREVQQLGQDKQPASARADPGPGGVPCASRGHSSGRGTVVSWEEPSL